MNDQNPEKREQSASAQTEPASENSGSFAVTPRVVFIFAVIVALIIILLNVDAVANLFNSVFGIIAPVLIGIMIAYIINPLYKMFDRRIFKTISKRGKTPEPKAHRRARALGLFLTMFLLIAIIVTLLFLIIPQFVENLQKLIDKLPDLSKKVMAWAEQTFGGDAAETNSFRENILEFIRNFTSELGNLSSTLKLNDLVSAVSSVASAVFNFVVALVVCVYALLERDKFVAQGKKILFSLFPVSRANGILTAARYGNDVFGKFITGKLLTSTVVGIVTFIFMALCGMPYALLSSVIVAFCNVIPFIGPFIGGFLTVFIVLITDFRQGIIYLIFFIILQQIDGNIMSPMITEDRTGVSKFWVTFAVLLFGGMFGIPGMLFAVPLFAVIYYCIKIFVERSLVAKGLPVETTSYYAACGFDPVTKEALYSVGEQRHIKKPRLSFKSIIKALFGKKVTVDDGTKPTESETDKTKPGKN